MRHETPPPECPDASDGPSLSPQAHALAWEHMLNSLQNKTTRYIRFQDQLDMLYRMCGCTCLTHKINLLNLLLKTSYTTAPQEGITEEVILTILEAEFHKYYEITSE